MTNEEVRNKIQDAIDKHDDLLFVVKTHKLRWYAHFSRAFGMAMTISARDEGIMITSPCNVYPLTPHFYIVKLGFTGVYIIFLFLP